MHQCGNVVALAIITVLRKY